MKNFNLKNKMISLAGALVMLIAGLASIFSYAGTNNNTSIQTENSAHAVYTEESFKSQADSLIAEINSKNTNVYANEYSLKDDYPLFAEHQTTSNLCWAYSGLKVLETTLMLKTGEYYNFSEMSVAYFAYLSKFSSTIDSFGSFKKLDETQHSGKSHHNGAFGKRFGLLFFHFSFPFRERTTAPGSFRKKIPHGEPCGVAMRLKETV